MSEKTKKILKMMGKDCVEAAIWLIIIGLFILGVAVIPMVMFILSSLMLAAIIGILWWYSIADRVDRDESD